MKRKRASQLAEAFVPSGSLPDEWETPSFELVRVETPDDLPPASPATIDVALLDMNHGYPNVGHDAMVAFVRDISARHAAELEDAQRRVRVLSYAIRDRLMIPDHATGRHQLYLGTGGPGHLDPRRNTADRGAAEVREDPSWEAPLWRLFDDISADDSAALYGVCHTFGLLCRWSGAAEPVLRGPDKGRGASASLVRQASRRFTYQLVAGARIALLRSDSHVVDLPGRRQSDRLRIG
jgi:hypothetical protein